MYRDGRHTDSKLINRSQATSNRRKNRKRMGQTDRQTVGEHNNVQQQNGMAAYHMQKQMPKASTQHSFAAK